MNELDIIEQLTIAVEQGGANIAPTYQEYMPLAFAVANSCGEEGRSFFHRLCRLSDKYRHDEADKLYDHALQNGRGGNSLGTVFHLAQLAGIRFDKKLANLQNLQAPFTPTHTCARGKGGNTEQKQPQSTEGTVITVPAETSVSLPCFVEYRWPLFLQQVIDCGDSPAQRDILLLGALTVFGATLNKLLSFTYGRKSKYPCLQTFVIAPPASGKGALTWVRRLAEPLHDSLMAAYSEKMKIYRREKAQWDVLGKEKVNIPEPEQPCMKMFLIAGDNSGAGMLENLMDADGAGLICETEADTVSTAIGTDYGHWSDTLRKAFDHDRLSYNRRTDQEYREVKKSYLSVLLSGTPAQVKPLIPSTENGLFSRQLFYYMHGIWAWINQFESGEADLEAIFTDIGLEWKKQLDLMKTHGVHTLRLTDEQKQEFNTLFSDLFFRSGLANDNEMSSSIARLAVNTCRIMAEVAMIRALECNQPYQFKNSSIHLLTPDKEIATDNIKDGIITRWDVTITAEDFKAVLELVTPLYRHATHILSFLPSTEVKHRANADRDALFEAMGNQFTRAQLSEQATIMKIKPNTAFGWLNRLIKKGLFTNADDKGIYTRTHVCVC